MRINEEKKNTQKEQDIKTRDSQDAYFILTTPLGVIKVYVRHAGDQNENNEDSGSRNRRTDSEHYSWARTGLGMTFFMAWILRLISEIVFFSILLKIL